jgi:hypothetical protein
VIPSDKYRGDSAFQRISHQGYSTFKQRDSHGGSTRRCHYKKAIRSSSSSSRYGKLLASSSECSTDEEDKGLELESPTISPFRHYFSHIFQWYNLSRRLPPCNHTHSSQ